MRILANGKLGPIDTVASSGSTFEEASTDAVRRWTYVPMTRKGSPAECDNTVTITFLPEGKIMQNSAILMSQEYGQ